MKAVAQTFCPSLWSFFLFSFRAANLFWYWHNERMALSGRPSQSQWKIRAKGDDSFAGLLKRGWREGHHLLLPCCFAKVTQGLESAALLQHEHCRHFYSVVFFWWRLRQGCSILACPELLNRHSPLWICEVRLFLAADAADYAWQPTVDSPPCFSFITCSWTGPQHANELLG